MFIGGKIVFFPIAFVIPMLLHPGDVWAGEAVRLDLDRLARGVDAGDDGGGATAVG